MKRPKKKKPLSEKQRASDEALREELRHFDVNKFGKMLAKAVNPPKRRLRGASITRASIPQLKSTPAESPK